MCRIGVCSARVPLADFCYRPAFAAHKMASVIPEEAFDMRGSTSGMQPRVIEMYKPNERIWRRKFLESRADRQQRRQHWAARWAAENARSHPSQSSSVAVLWRVLSLRSAAPIAAVCGAMVGAGLSEAWRFVSRIGRWEMDDATRAYATVATLGVALMAIVAVNRFAAEREVGDTISTCNAGRREREARACTNAALGATIGVPAGVAFDIAMHWR
jgi:hypothetical protein